MFSFKCKIVIDKMLISTVLLILLISKCSADDILGCGGFIKSHAPLDYSKIEIGLYTKGGILKEKTECAPTNGYFFLPLYEKGEYTLKVHPPPGWSFAPSQKELVVDGVTDLCSMGQDVNFSFNGFGITGQVITAGQTKGPSGVAVQLINDKGEVRNTITTAGGEFSFTPVVPGKYTVKASHHKWQLNPAEAVVVVKEGNTVLPTGLLSVKGYDVKGTVTGFGQPTPGVYVMLYSNKVKQKLKVEGCNTALLHGVKDAPICHSVTNEAGEFTFGSVPAGAYELAVLAAAPGQSAHSYNVKPGRLSVQLAHDSLYIQNAFEITGFDLTGWTSADEQRRLPNVQVSVDGVPAASSDQSGAFTVTALRPGTYTLTAAHDSCSFESVTVKVGGGGGGAVELRAGSWRVCGQLEPPPRAARAVLLEPAAPAAAAAAPAPLRASVQADGAWCVLAPPGDYSARVQLAEPGAPDQLHYYPERAAVRVRSAPVPSVRFSQLRGVVRGEVRCLPGDACDVSVELRAGSAAARSARAVAGQYRFEDVGAGALAAQVEAARRCWRRERVEAALDRLELQLPAFEQTGYALDVSSEHEVELRWASAAHGGVARVRPPLTRLCLPSTERYTLTPLGCHEHAPASSVVDMAAPEPLRLQATAHAHVVEVVAPLLVDDLRLTVERRGRSEEVGPLAGVAAGGAVRYAHALQLAPGERCAVAAASRALLLPGRRELRAGAACVDPALRLLAVRARILAGRTRPAVAGVRLTLLSEDIKMTQTTGADGTYEFDPIDASKPFTLTAEKESYVFGEREEDGTIPANKLGAIHVTLLEEKDGSPLQGALVSASGGEFRRTGAAAGGALSFSALAADRYYVKPLYNEYRFEPPHATLQLAPGEERNLTFKAARVAWSWSGRVLSAAGAGWPGATLQASPDPRDVTACSTLHATTDQHGAFRVRGLLPQCTYTLSLKPGAEAELRGLRLLQPPPTISVRARRDVAGALLLAAQPQQLTDAAVLVRAARADHYRSLRLTLSSESSSASVYSSRLDAAGVERALNPGLMYTLPRLPADNNTYVVRIESSLSKASHSYEELTFYFTSDGRYKHITFDFAPQLRSSEQELGHTSVGAVPLVLLAALLYWQRARISAHL